ncbi:MAG TPA: NAD(P)H-binding protein [Solirubrobacterales bacterium]|nr:NAD(P)H-binding protein [Solirubrobacterales bacterium]
MSSAATPSSLIRKPEQEDDLHEVGVESVLCDLEGGDDVAEAVSGFGAYLRAKAEADRALADSGLAYTIVRPGLLADDPPTGLVQIGEHLDRGDIPRADVAAVLAAVLGARNTIGTTFDLISGNVSVVRAVAELKPSS